MQTGSKTQGQSRPNVKVGDRVEFYIDLQVYSDTVDYIDGDTIEGKTYDLTHIRFEIIKES